MRSTSTRQKLLTPDFFLQVTRRASHLWISKYIMQTEKALICLKILFPQKIIITQRRRKKMFKNISHEIFRKREKLLIISLRFDCL